MEPSERTDDDRDVVHVCGHRNPDTDSVAAAIGYAELCGRRDPGRRYVPSRLGELNPQTNWALERSGAPTPEYLPHILLRVGDVMRREFPVVADDEPVRSAGQLMVQEGLDLLPVTDADGRLAGVLTERSLALRYVRESLGASKLGAPTSVTRMAGVLGGEVLHGPEREVGGRVWVLSMAVESQLRDVSEGDVAVVGDRPDAQRDAIEGGVAALVLSNGTVAPDDVRALAEDAGVPVIATQLDSYVAGRMITLSAPCRSLIERDPLTVRRADLMADVAEGVKDVSYRAAVVVDGDGRPIGLVTRDDLVRPEPRKVILVDHAEQAQSVPGVEHAEIVEILDHHHIGSIETTLPVRATFDPVGSTSTLVTERFRAAALRPGRATATMLLAAVLSDTVILNSPTTTDRDRAVVDDLADIAGIDPIAFGREMFDATSAATSADPDELVGRDAKAYDLRDGKTICIAQLETVGDRLLDRVDELRDAVGRRREDEGHSLVALMVTDVLAHGTELIVDGDVALAERALDAEARDGVISLPGVMSRKKQVAPRLLGAT